MQFPLKLLEWGVQCDQYVSMISMIKSSFVSTTTRMGVILHGGLCDKLSTVHHGHSHGGGGGHGHSHADDRNHGHSHSNASSNHSHSPQNMNVRAALIHVIGDLVQSIGVIVAAFVIKYWVRFFFILITFSLHSLLNNLCLFFVFSLSFLCLFY